MAEPTAATKIWLALKRQIEVAAGDIPVAWPGEAFEPTGTFLAVSEVMTPAERRSLRASDPHRLRGSLLLRLSIPMSDKQEREVWREAAAQIATAFPADLLLEYDGQSVRVREKASVTGAYQDGGWWHQTVQVRYETSL
ncbi:phage tail terminator-like protein [Falsirhodobacter sp. 20TX0035]|uniref:phage tail terminator-like protein n=1 Tax=Falsirhodobacter sp. 20TX0035 TaxID=3022019 RepID=UPI002331048E|nr:phage tail terminator-like protein [Falsirhodobacter sp. 20TX0035]MDB6454696.1 phage tail terminator-like protein [Falsirhodobacter sp. 20TX0035]